MHTYMHDASIHIFANLRWFSFLRTSCIVIRLTLVVAVFNLGRCCCCCCSVLSEQLSLLKIVVYHRNLLGLDEFLGHLSIPLDQFQLYERPRSRQVLRSAFFAETQIATLSLLIWMRERRKRNGRKKRYWMWNSELVIKVPRAAST